VEAGASAAGQSGYLPFEDRMFVYHFSYQRLIAFQYEFERQKYAQDLINFDREFSALFSGKPKTSENQDGVTHEQFLRSGCLNGDLQQCLNYGSQGFPDFRRFQQWYRCALHAFSDCRYYSSRLRAEHHHWGADAASNICSCSRRSSF
jgi:hypothetical protein